MVRSLKRESERERETRRFEVADRRRRGRVEGGSRVGRGWVEGGSRVGRGWARGESSARGIFLHLDVTPAKLSGEHFR
jgi:hypothetical protein